MPDLLEQLEALLAEERARLQRRAADRQAELERRVAEYLRERPDASGNEIARVLHLRRVAVSEALRALRAPGRFPLAGKHRNGGGAG